MSCWDHDFFKPPPRWLWAYPLLTERGGEGTSGLRCIFSVSLNLFLTNPFQLRMLQNESSSRRQVMSVKDRESSLVGKLKIGLVYLKKGVG